MRQADRQKREVSVSPRHLTCLTVCLYISLRQFPFLPRFTSFHSQHPSLPFRKKKKGNRAQSVAVSLGTSARPFLQPFADPVGEPAGVLLPSRQAPRAGEAMGPEETGGQFPALPNVFSISFITHEYNE